MGTRKAKQSVNTDAEDYEVAAVQQERARGKRSALHELLLECCPPERRDGQEVRSISILAKAINCSPQNIYKHIVNDRLPPHIARKLYDLNQRRIAMRRFTPYVFAARSTES